MNTCVDTMDSCEIFINILTNLFQMSFLWEQLDSSLYALIPVFPQLIYNPFSEIDVHFSHPQI